MKHIRGRTKVDCGIASLAMVLDTTYEAIEAYITCGELCDQQLVDILHMYGYACMSIAREDDELFYQNNEARFQEYLRCYDGLVSKRMPGGQWHMAAWCSASGRALDPAREDPIDVLEWQPEEFLAIVKIITISKNFKFALTLPRVR